METAKEKAKEKTREGASNLRAFCMRHKIGVLVVVVFLSMVIYGNFFYKGDQSRQAQAASSDTLAVSVVGFMESYGTYSYQDALSVHALEGYAVPELANAAINQRIADYTVPQDPQDSETVKALALGRMEAQGLVKTTYVKSIKQLEKTEDSYQLSVAVTEWTFTAEKGMKKQDSTYLVSFKPATVGGVGSPYQAVRILKQ
jgi:hypothetical protein